MDRSQFSKEPLNAYQQVQEKTKEFIMANTLTPRKAKAEQKKLLMQTVFFLGATVVLLVAMVLVIIPGLIRIAGIFGGGVSFTQSDTIAPRIPLYSAPVAATIESTLPIEGYAEPKSTVFLVLNGGMASEVHADDEGKFSLEASLQEGENTIAFYSKDEAGNESELGKEYRVIFDKTVPELTIDSPADQTTVTNLRERMITVNGKVSEQVKVYVNDRLVSGTTNAEGQYEFSGSYQLQEGENVIKVKAVDPAGNQVEQERKVTFKP